MRVFVYDATLSGLLSAVFDAYTRKEFPERLLTRRETPPLRATVFHTVVTREDQAARVMAGLRKRLSAKALRSVMHAWMSEEPGCGDLLFRAMRKTFDSRTAVETDFTDEAILGVYLLAKKVRREEHQLEGFVRFQKTAQNIYFAVIAPRYNVLPLLLPHFADRFSDQRWAVYDYGRGYGMLYDGGEFREVSLEPGQLPNGRLDAAHLADDEAFIQELWKRYFKALAIKERVNPKLQSRCMPRRYWQYLLEKQV